MIIKNWYTYFLFLLKRKVALARGPVNGCVVRGMQSRGSVQPAALTSPAWVGKHSPRGMLSLVFLEEGVALIIPVRFPID